MEFVLIVSILASNGTPVVTTERFSNEAECRTATFAIGEGLLDFSGDLKMSCLPVAPLGETQGS